MDPISPQPQVSQPAPMQASPAPEHKKVGPIIAVLIIVLVLVIGALYLFASRINEEQAPVDSSVATESTPSTAVSNSSSQQTVTPITNNSDDVDSLEADLNTSVKGLDNQNF